MVKVASQFSDAESALGFSFGARAQTEMEIWCVKASKLTVNVQATLLHLFHTIMCSLHVRQGTGI